MNKIDDGLVEIEEEAEEKHKELVNKKVEELRGEVDEINKKWKWGRIKDILEEDIKDGLSELKNKIEKLEKAVVPEHKPGENVINRDIGGRELVPFGEGGDYSIATVGNRTNSEELVLWRKLGQSPEQVDKNIRELVKGFLQLKTSHDGFQENLQVVVKKSSSDDLANLYNSVTQTGVEYARLGSELGGWFPGLKQAGGLAGAYLGTVQGFSLVGVKIYEDTLYVGTDLVKKTGTDLKDYALETQKDLKDHVEHHADNAKELAEKVLDNTKDVFETGIKIFDVGGAAKDIANSLGESISSTQKAKEEAKIKIAESEGKARAEEIESLKERLEELKREKEKQIKELKEEKEKQIEKLEERIGKKDERIGVLEAKIEKLEEKTEIAQGRLLARVEEIAKSKSSLPLSPSPSGSKQ